MASYLETSALTGVDIFYFWLALVRKFEGEDQTDDEDLDGGQRVRQVTSEFHQLEDVNTVEILCESTELSTTTSGIRRKVVLLAMQKEQVQKNKGMLLI